MADEITGVTIPELPEGGTLTGAEQFEMVQDGVSRRTTADEIKTLVGAVTDIQSTTLDVSIADGVATVDLPYEAIPLSGTETGAPITGDLQVKDLDGESFKMFYNNADPEEQGLGFQFIDLNGNTYATAQYANVNDGSQYIIGNLSGQSTLIYIAPSAAYTNEVRVEPDGAFFSIRGNQIITAQDNGTGSQFGVFGRLSPQAAAIADPTDLASLLTALPSLLAAMRAYGLIAE
jgi:hypothetical protein